jgi:hypothetical protein
MGKPDAATAVVAKGTWYLNYITNCERQNAFSCKDKGTDKGTGRSSVQPNLCTEGTGTLGLHSQFQVTRATNEERNLQDSALKKRTRALLKKMTKKTTTTMTISKKKKKKKMMMMMATSER